jgi:hypothetical protein
MDGDDVGVADAGEDAGFAEEPADGNLGGQLGADGLDGDDAIQSPVAGKEHEAHAAATQQSRDFVLLPDCPVETSDQDRRGRCGGWSG